MRSKATNFLITGSSGQLAKQFQKILAARDMKFEAPPEKELDITNFKQVDSVINKIRPNTILNCAAYNLVDKAEEDKTNAFLVNGTGVRNLVVSSKRVDATFVHFSTDYVFDGEKNSPYLISDKPNPINKYGESKLLGEQFVTSLANKYFLIRLSWVFGGGENSFPVRLLQWAENKDELRIVDDQISSPSYVEDLATATIDLLDSGVYGLYHMTNSNFCSRYEWARFILQKIGWKGNLVPAKSEDFKTPAKRPKFSVLDNFHLKDTIGSLLPHWQESTEKFLKTRGAEKGAA